MSDSDYKAADSSQAEKPKKVFEPLNDDQIEYANELLEELHPLEKTPVREAFPWFGAVTCYKKEAKVEGEGADTEALLTQKEKAKTVMINGKEIVKKPPKKKKNPIGAAAQEADPIASLGFGIVAYLDLLWTLMWTFLLYSIFLAPTILFFQGGSAYDNVKAKSSYLDTYIGNLGYSSVQCSQIPVSVGKLSISCPFGTIGEIYDSGVNPDTDTQFYCATKAGVNDNCPAYGHNANVWAQRIEDITASPVDKYTLDFRGIFSCGTVDTTFFISYSCVQDAASQEEKYNALALAVGTCVLIALLFTVSIRFMYQGGKIKQIEWDCATVTAGDYAAVFNIKHESYIHWRDNVYEAAGGDVERNIAPGLSLKELLKKEIEEKLDAWINDSANAWALDALYGSNKKGKSQYGGTKVADIVFSFNNAALIHALRKRGQCIAGQDFDAMRAAEAEISELFQDFDNLTVPTAAFITFESDDSAVLADLVKKSNLTLLGQEFIFDKCSEPTDIIWENRHYTKWDYLKRQAGAFAIIAILLLGSFALIYWISAFAAKMAAVYPPKDCDGITAAYGDQDALRPFAVDDYEFTQAPKNEGMASSGCLQCFCQQEYKDDPEHYYTNTYGSPDGSAICAKYSDAVFSVYIWTTALSYLLIGINYVLRTVCIMLVDWIGFPTETERLSKTTSVTFYVQFFNSAFLLMMTNANLSGQVFSFGLISGKIPDFNSAWFRTVGDIIVGAMVFNAIYPVIEVGMYWGLRVLFRCLDRGCTCRGRTKSTSIQGYVSVQQGPVYFMHFKYSTILTSVYITMLYGVGMPILFPIACFSYLVLYILEKTYLFYGYVMPPMYDERLSNDVLNKLQFAPLLFTIFGYWMVSSNQLISNEYLTPKTLSTDLYDPQHGYASIFSPKGWEGLNWPLLVTFILLNFIWYFGEWFAGCMYKCFPSMQIGDIEIDESIDNYWKSLDADDRKWSKREEENARENLSMKLLTDSQYDALCASEQTEGKTLQGTHSYDILANPLYLDDFQYVTAAEDDRAEMIIDDDDDEGNDAAQSDLIRIGLNLAFITEDKAKKFKFDKDALTELCSRHKLAAAIQ